jgi:hypothetical protein
VTIFSWVTHNSSWVYQWVSGLAALVIAGTFAAVKIFSKRLAKNIMAQQIIEPLQATDPETDPKPNRTPPDMA